MGTNSLSAFSYEWVGGNIRGLQALQDQCDQVASQIGDADQALTHQVSSVVGAGGWTGKAADSFTNAWDADAKAGAQLADAWQKIGSIASTLAAELAALESALEGAADRLEKQGVYVDPATGLPSPNIAASGKACTSPQAAAANAKLANEYLAYRSGILKQADAARTHATNALYTVTTELLPNQFDYGQLTNDLDGLRGLWAVPTQYRMELEKVLGEADAVKGKVYAATWDELLAKHKVSGYNAQLEKTTIDKLKAAQEAVAEQEGKLASSPPESILSKLAGGDSEGLSAAGAAAMGIKAIPFVGASTGAVIQVIQDRENHESWRHSIVDGVVSNGASLGAGLAVTAGVAAVVGSGSVVAVAGGAVLGGVAAIGVGDGVHNLIQENWGADIDKHGFLPGIGHGVADSFDKTRHDLAHYGDDILHLL